MRLRLGIGLIVAAAAGCGSSNVAVVTASTDGGVVVADLAAGGHQDLAVSTDLGHAADLAMSNPDHADLGVAPDLGRADLGRPVLILSDLGPGDLAPAPTPDGGSYMPPGSDDSPVAHAPPAPMSGATTMLAGQNVLDVSTDQGGGVWAATSSKIYYFPAGRSTPFTYDQSSGLARGWYTWNDTWFDYGSNAPVTFTSVAGGRSGEVVVGNIGAIADRMEVNPSTGAVTRIDNMKVAVDSTDPTVRTEQEEQLKRVVAVLRVIADLNGTFTGTSYLGGFHGYYAFHGINGDCGCQNFEQHNHAFPAWAPDEIAGSDVRGLALSPDGDVWQGDRDAVVFWPQRSLGANADFFQDPTVMVDVFPGVRDEVWGLGVDRSNGVYVASYGNGLAYLAPATHQPTYWSRAGTLPQDHLTDVTVDGSGEVWIATDEGGVARFNPSANRWTYYTNASGLASNAVHHVYVDQYASARVIYFATKNGITVFRP